MNLVSTTSNNLPVYNCVSSGFSQMQKSTWRKSVSGVFRKPFKYLWGVVVNEWEGYLQRSG